MESLDIRCIVSGKETGGAVSGFEEFVPPGAGPPLHSHRSQMEIFHIIEGTFRFKVGDEDIELGPGGAAVVPAGAPHAFRNVGTGPGRIHFELLPSKNSEEGFRRIVDDPGSIQDMNAFFEEYGMDLLGPPLD